MKKEIITKDAPAAIGPYSQGVSVNTMVFTSGQLPINPVTGAMPEGIAAQTEQSLINVKAVLEAAGSGLDMVLKTTVFLQNMDDFLEMNRVYETFFANSIFPARSAVEVARLPKNALVEIEASAIVKD